MPTREQLALNRAFGIAIKRLRASRKMTQEDLAYGTGISLTSVARMESGAQGVRLETILKMARALGISGGSLVTECEKSLKKGATA